MPCPRRLPALQLLTLLQEKAAEGGDPVVKRSVLQPSDKEMVDLCRILTVSYGLSRAAVSGKPRP